MKNSIIKLLKKKMVFNKNLGSSQLYTGFTLAEVLITLGIIGVIASLTIPNLLKNTNDNEFKTMWKKKYSELSQVVNQIYAEENVTYADVTTGEWQKLPRYFCKMNKHLKFVKSGINCPINEDEIPASSASWPTAGKYYWHENDKWNKKNGDLARINIGYRSLSAIMPDGSLIELTVNHLLIDVNGYKKPNIVGKDIFAVAIYLKEPKLYTPGLATTEWWPGAMGNEYDSYVYKDTYEDDCLNGTGWGCSTLYLLK